MLKITALAISLFIYQYSFAKAGSAKAFVSLSPAGDFVANMKATGSASLEGSKVTAKNVVIDLKSVTTGLELRDDHAKNKYLEVSKYPEAILIEASGENGQGSGKLKFHGKEGQVTGTYKVQNGKTLTAEFNIKLSEYGITDISYKGIGVEDNVKIEVQLPIVAAAAQEKQKPSPKTPAKKAVPPQPPKKK